MNSSADLLDSLRAYKLPYTKEIDVETQLSYQLEELENDNTLLLLILTCSSDPILITNAIASITFVNPAWEALIGYTFEEVKGKNPRILQSGKTPKKYYKKLWRALSKGESFSSEDVIDRRKDGSKYQIHSTIYPVRKGNQTVYYVQIQHDITKRKYLEELRKEFLSAAAHELKTPLTVLKLLSQMHLAKAEKQGNGVLKTGELALIDQEVDRLTRLVNDILDSSRFETGKLSLNFQRITVADLIKRVAEKIHIYANSHIVIFGEIPKDMVVIADPDRIEQVIINLVSNAVRYSESGTTITVGVTIEGKFALFFVKDEGIGIKKAAQKHIFDRYYQVKNAQEKSRVGFGLGLYISKEIIKRHKGKIWVESKVGKGSTFYFRLPLVKKEII